MVENGKKNQGNFEVTIDSNILEVVENIDGAAEIFAEYGLPCAGCAAASYEKISDIIGEFGVDGDKFIQAINKNANN
jgi:hybrid cluster-associated redox disulfide protein